MKKLFTSLLLVCLVILGSYAQTIEVVNPSSINATYAIRGTLSNTSGGSSSAAVSGINKSTTGFGAGVYGTQAGAGYGVWGSSGVNGIGVVGSALGVNGVGGSFSNAIGKALSTTGGLKFSGPAVSPADGRVMTSMDFSGNAQWEDAVIYTDWAVLTSAWRDTTVDGSANKTNHLFLNCFNAAILDKGDVQVFFQIPSDLVAFPLPYTSNAGGTANTLWFEIKNNKVQIYRFTHNNSASIGASSSLKFRVVITPGKSVCTSGNVFKPSPEANPCNSTVPCGK